MNDFRQQVIQIIHDLPLDFRAFAQQHMLASFLSIKSTPTFIQNKVAGQLERVRRDINRKLWKTTD